MRIKFLDISKGVLIILVVIGHLPTQFKEIIYYFHMPCFFILSGVFIKESIGSTNNYLIKKAKSLLVPYLVYLLLFGLIFYDSEKDFLFKLILGGRFLVGPFSPFWFITALFFAYVLFYIIEKFISKKYRFLTVIILYSAACLESIYFKDFPKLFYIPLGLDIGLLIVLYLNIGRSIKPIVDMLNESFKLQLFVFILSSIGLLLFFILYYHQVFSYTIDLKYVIYPSPITNLFVPLLFFSFLISVTKLLEKSLHLLSYFGEATLVIMYFHLPLLYLLKDKLPLGVLIAFACIAPLFIQYIFNKNIWTRRFFLGRW